MYKTSGSTYICTKPINMYIVIPRACEDYHLVLIQKSLHANKNLMSSFSHHMDVFKGHCKFSCFFLLRSKGYLVSDQKMHLYQYFLYAAGICPTFAFGMFNFCYNAYALSLKSLNIIFAHLFDKLLIIENDITACFHNVTK